MESSARVVNALSSLLRSSEAPSFLYQVAFTVKHSPLEHKVWLQLWFECGVVYVSTASSKLVVFSFPAYVYIGIHSSQMRTCLCCGCECKLP